MPLPVNITIKNIVYQTPILNEEMDNLAQQIFQKKEEIANLNANLTLSISQLQTLNQQFMALYIQQTGSFPA